MAGGTYRCVMVLITYRDPFPSFFGLVLNEFNPLLADTDASFAGLNIYAHNRDPFPSISKGVYMHKEKS